MARFPGRATHVVALIGVLLLIASGCGAPAAGPEGAPSGGGSSGASSTSEEVPSALDDRQHPSFPEPLIDVGDLRSGGPPPDGIPAIDDPKFQSADEVGWLEGDEPVLSLTVGEETRAYPLLVMTWHEIVNDVVDGVPVAVTYCPLCNSGVAFERAVGDRLLDFGTSGLLYVDNLVMYDRQTESLWPQLTGQASVGHLTGEQLAAIPMGVVGWDQFRSAHPEALVLTTDTGHSRDYGRNPYAGYDDPDGALLFGPPGDPDTRLPVKERVIGIELDGESVAVRRSRVAEAGVLPVEVAGRRLVLWHRAGQLSALDATSMPDSREIGTVGGFVPAAAGRDLTFTARKGGFVDDQTSSTWNVLGHAVAGPLAGERLEPVTHLDTFWFAWVGFQPETRLVQ